jgi:triphosphatase
MMPWRLNVYSRLLLQDYRGGAGRENAAERRNPCDGTGVAMESQPEEHMNRRQDPREIELKLEVGDPAGLADIPSHPALASGAVRTHHLRAIYFDTPDHALRSEGLSLRVREDGGRWIQTLKAARPAAGVALDRSEWEWEVAGPGLDLKRLKKTPLKPFLAQAASIGAIFEIRVERTSIDLKVGTSHLELAADAGHVDTDGQRQRFAEVEIELRNGSVRDVFALASTLADSLPLHLSLLTKSERGYQALRREAPQRVKAEPVVLSGAMTAGEAFQAIARACLRHLLANERIIRQVRDPDAVHQMRVALRRLRAALTLFRDVVQDGDVETVKAGLKWITGELGRARDLDVYIATILEPACDAQTDPELVQALSDARRERDSQYARLEEILASGRFRRLLLDAAAWIEAGPWLAANGEVRDAREKPVEDLARKQLKRRWRSVRRRLRHLREMDPAGRHEVRIAIKKLRYGSEFFASLFRQRGGRERQRKALQVIEALQETLGALNDLAVASTRDGGALAALTRDGEDETESLLSDAESRARSFDAIEPFWKPA